MDFDLATSESITGLLCTTTHMTCCFLGGGWIATPQLLLTGVPRPYRTKDRGALPRPRNARPPDTAKPLAAKASVSAVLMLNKPLRCRARSAHLSSGESRVKRAVPTHNLAHGEADASGMCNEFRRNAALRTPKPEACWLVANARKRAGSTRIYRRTRWQSVRILQPQRGAGEHGQKWKKGRYEPTISYAVKVSSCKGESCCALSFSEPPARPPAR